MKNEPYEGMFHEYMKGEMQVIAANIAVQQKTLAELVKEAHPGIQAKDGSFCHFKRTELELLASFLKGDEQKQLFLPILIEVVAGEGYIAIITRGEMEQKVVEHILDMPMRNEKNRIELQKPQLAVLRQNLRTTTGYIFLAKMST
jgi:uncharacterized protein (UPF0216 family)